MLCDVTPCLGSEFALEPHTGIPWQAGLRRGSALEADRDSMLVQEEGFYFVYSQVGPFDVIPYINHKGELLAWEPVTRYLTEEHGACLYYIYMYSFD